LAVAIKNAILDKLENVKIAEAVLKKTKNSL